MNRINDPWLEERAESALNTAIDAVLAEPIDQTAVSRVAKNALQLDFVIENQRPSLEELSQQPHSPGTTRPVLAPKHRSWTSTASWIGSLAALLLLMLIWRVSPEHAAFAQVVEKIQSYTSVRFHTAFQFGIDEPRTGTMLVRDDVVRLEQAKGMLVQIFDTQTGAAVILDTSRKIAQPFKTNQKGNPEMQNPIAELIAAKDKSVKFIGTDVLDGKKVGIYRLGSLDVMALGSGKEITLWADMESHLPVKIQMLESNPEHKMKLTFDQFEWNPNISKELLSTSIPNGYREAKVFEEPVVSPSKTNPVAQQDLSKGVFYAGRVPCFVEVDAKRNQITALLREDEKAPVQQRRPHELCQWDLTSGKIRWTQQVAGASQFAICDARGWLAIAVGQAIQIRELDSGKVIHVMESNYPLGIVSMNASGTKLALGFTRWGNDRQTTTGGIELWSLESMKLERTIEGLDRVDTLQFSPTSDLVLVGSINGSVKLYDAASGSLEFSFLSRGCASFSPDGKLIAMSSSDMPSDKKVGKVEVYDVETKQLTRSLASRSGRSDSHLLSIAFSAQSEYLAAADWNGSVTIWDLSNNQPLEGIKPSDAGVHSVRFVDLTTLFTGSEDGFLLRIPIRK